jgi:hypothetical protein
MIVSFADCRGESRGGKVDISVGRGWMAMNKSECRSKRADLDDVEYRNLNERAGRRVSDELRTSPGLDHLHCVPWRCVGTVAATTLRWAQAKTTVDMTCE